MLSDEPKNELNFLDLRRDKLHESKKFISIKFRLVFFFAFVESTPRDILCLKSEIL